MNGTLRWSLDEKTAKAALAVWPFPKREKPADQFQGRFLKTQKWNDRVIQPAKWNDGSLLTSPAEIIRQFQDGRYTQALALVIVWGSMWRTSQYIYGEVKPERIEQIERTLHNCAKSIEETKSIAPSWEILTGQLYWSAVITSKTLHFLCRSLGFTQNPPVALDGKLIRQKAWPLFVNTVTGNQRPDNWEGNSFEAYSRYMTAILTWADQKSWTTTQVEATVVYLIETPPD